MAIKLIKEFLKFGEVTPVYTKTFEIRDTFSQYHCLSLSIVTLRVTEAREQTTYRKNFILNKKFIRVVYLLRKGR